jgi:TorA maturation chaperone TorD
MKKSDAQEIIHFMPGVNHVREMFYQFLSRAFSREADTDFLDDALKILRFLQDIPEFVELSQEADIQTGHKLLKEFFTKIEGARTKETLNHLSREYANSFLGVGEKTAALCESVYVGHIGSLFQEPYFQVKKTYQAMDMERSEHFSEPDDHLSVELAYMATLCRLIIGSGDNGGAQLGYLRSQREFMQNHLIRWVPALLERLKEINTSTFYKGWGHILNGFTKVDLTLIGSLIEELETDRSEIAIEEKGKEVNH